MQTMQKIERIRNPSATLVRELLESSRPAVLLDMMKGWKALDWNFDYLKNQFGELNFRVSKNLNSSIGVQIERVTSGSCLTTLSSALPLEMHEEIGSLFEVEGLFIKGISGASLFMGAKDTVTPLHCDFVNGMNAHILGVKKWTLLSPDQSNSLYIRTEEKYSGYQLSDVDILHPDFNKHPLFLTVDPIETTVMPGEIMLTPAGWYHGVHLTENSLSVALPVTL